MRALGLEDGKRKTQGDVVSCLTSGYVGKLRKPLGKVWTSLPVQVSETGGPIMGSEAFVGVGEDSVLCADYNLSRFLGNVSSDRGGKKSVAMAT